MQLSKISIPATLLTRLSHLSQSRYPEESCAALFGEHMGINSLNCIVTKISELINITHSAVEFQLDEMELYSHWRINENEGLSLLGIFHSHPDEAYVSQYDKRVIVNTGKLYPELVWVVYGNQSQIFKAFRLHDNTRIKEILIDRIN